MIFIDSLGNKTKATMLFKSEEQARKEIKGFIQAICDEPKACEIFLDVIEELNDMIEGCD